MVLSFIDLSDISIIKMQINPAVKKEMLSLVKTAYFQCGNILQTSKKGYLKNMLYRTCPGQIKVM